MHINFENAFFLLKLKIVEYPSFILSGRCKKSTRKFLVLNYYSLLRTLLSASQLFRFLH